jgi:multicomponent K+:H+ antiporter subunit D
VVALLTACAMLTLSAGPALSLAHTTAKSLYDRAGYIDAVRGAKVEPSPAATEASK